MYKIRFEVEVEKDEESKIVKVKTRRENQTAWLALPEPEDVYVGKSISLFWHFPGEDNLGVIEFKE